MVHLWQHLWLWFAIHTGTYNESGPYYAFFSGFGSDIGELAILGGVIQLYRAHNCHVDGCRRIGRHILIDVDGTQYKVCRKHHSGVPDKITEKHIQNVYKRAKISKSTYER